MKAHDFLTNLAEAGKLHATKTPHQYRTTSDTDNAVPFALYQAVTDKTAAYTEGGNDTPRFTFNDGSYIELDGDDTVIAHAPEYRILSIDAWREPDGGWTWNNWYDVGRIPTDSTHWPPRELLKWLRTEGYLSISSAGKLAVEDDGYNIVILHKSTRKPLYAVEYGANL